MENKIHLKEKIPPINILFNSSLSEYNLYYTDNNYLTSVYNIQSNLVSKDGLINMTKRIKNIKFIGLPTLIEFCKNEKLYSLQIVFEWINFFIYKVRMYLIILLIQEERKVFDSYRNDNNFLIPGIKSLIEKISNEKQEMQFENGFKFMYSNIRNLLIKLIFKIMNNSIPHAINNFNSFLNRFMLYIITLNFEDASNLLKEVMNSKEKKKVYMFNNTYN